MDFGEGWNQICLLHAAHNKRLEERKVRTGSEVFKAAIVPLWLVSLASLPKGAMHKSQIGSKTWPLLHVF